MTDNHIHSLVFYRKYRPKRFDEFVNQKVIKQTLQNALILKKISHGYLFAGVRGTGKTTMARLFSKTLNCLNPQIYERLGSESGRIEPCNECEICVEINEGRSFDLVEIDAASNRGIDEIRDLKQGVKFFPVKAKYKVFIIDEAHMLTSFAFNALLKTLEEPPEHVIFILATTEPEKLPATILSRVQRFDFKKLSIPDMVSRLKYIAQKEQLEIEDGAIKLIAYLADGSVRDAESILSQLAAFSYNRQITISEVEQIVGSVNLERIFNFLELLAKKDLRGAIVYLNDLQDMEYQIYEVIRLSVDIMEKLLVLKIDRAFEKRLRDEFSYEQVEQMKELAKIFDKDQLRQFSKDFLYTLPQIRKAVVPTLPVELVIFELLGKK